MILLTIIAGWQVPILPTQKMTSQSKGYPGIWTIWILIGAIPGKRGAETRTAGIISTINGLPLLWFVKQHVSTFQGTYDRISVEQTHRYFKVNLIIDLVSRLNGTSRQKSRNLDIIIAKVNLISDLVGRLNGTFLKKSRNLDLIIAKVYSIIDLVKRLNGTIRKQSRNLDLIFGVGRGCVMALIECSVQSTNQINN